MVHGHWWERRSTVALLVIASMIPLLWPPIPPLIDLPGHMGRYRVQLDAGSPTMLDHFYAFRWSLIGNLGVDLLVIPFAKLFGLELGTKLIVLAIPALTAGGFLWIAREVHGEVPPTALFALPLAYGHPFLFGFVNFSLSMALALNAFALWLRLARQGRLRLRAGAFAIIAPLLWLVHTFGWGTLGVLAFSAELVRQHDARPSWFRATVAAAIHCLVLAPPIALMLVWRSGHVGGFTGRWFQWGFKWDWLRMTLRDRWPLFDQLSVLFLATLPLVALVRRDLGFSRNLVASTLFLALVFVLLPRIVFGSAYADMRLTPYLLATAVIAIRLRPRFDPRFAKLLAVAGLAFFVLRTGAASFSLGIASRVYDRALVALDHVPPGARVVSFVGHECRFQWSTNRMEHLPALAIVRRRAFSNDQWQMAGAQLLRAKMPDAQGFRSDPSQIVTERPCPREVWRSLDQSLAMFPRAAFDFVWLIDPPRFDRRLLRGMSLVWGDRRNALYRIDGKSLKLPGTIYPQS